MPSKIEWTEETWNPVTGCSKVSEGCKNCYAETLSLRFGWSQHPWAARFAAENVVLHPERLWTPFIWKRPRRVFVNSMSDLFHEQVPDDYILDVLAVMERAEQHQFQVLTKRPARMRDIVTRYCRANLQQRDGYRVLPNVWLGVSVEKQRWAQERIPVLLDTPAAVRFVSCEPLLGLIDLRPYLPRLNWVIAGGESSGPAKRALLERCTPGLVCDRACERCGGTAWIPKSAALQWVRDLRDQCLSAGVPFFFKQWGGPRPRSGGRILDGRVWDEMADGTEQGRRIMHESGEEGI